jgi:hypothetical protein
MGPGGPAHELNERAGAQAHFIDLCRVLGVPEPDDPARYCFERGVTKTGSAAGRTDGFADVWLRGHFAWEYKAPGKSLEGALRQLMMYALPLESPPLLVVSDRLRIEVHTHFTGTPSEKHVFALEDITRPEVQQRLRALWEDPESFKPKRSNRDITEEAARTFAGTAERLRTVGVAPEQVSHFLTQCVFSFFAEDVGLLPVRLFERLVGVQLAPEALRAQLGKLFETMREGGLFGVEAVPWFNGGLFARIDATIFGTLFERGLDPAKRSQLGAQFTDAGTILRLVEPVVQRPLLAEWQTAKAAIATQLEKRDRLRAEAALIPSTTKALKDKYARVRTRANEAQREAQRGFGKFLERLRAYRVLDPACGSGNFLFLALKCLKDIDHQVNLEAEALGLERQHDVTGPHNVLGIELNEYASRASARDGVDRRAAMAHPARLRLQDPAGAGTAGPYRVPRCRARRRWPRGGLAGGGCRRRQSALRRRQEDARRVGRRLYRSAARGLQGSRARWCGFGLLLVREGEGADRGRHVAARGAGGDEFDPTVLESRGSSARAGDDHDLRRVARRALGQ